jgi:hypothetical protein
VNPAGAGGDARTLWLVVALGFGTLLLLVVAHRHSPAPTTPRASGTSGQDDQSRPENR